MTPLAASVSASEIWLVPLAVVAVVLVGVVVVSVVLVRIVRSVSFSLRELGELRQVLEAQAVQRNAKDDEPCNARED